MHRFFTLIPDWKKCWRFASVQAASLLAVLSLLQLQALPLIEPLVPPARWPYVTAGFGLLIVALRIISQPSVSGLAQQSDMSDNSSNGQGGFIVEQLLIYASVACVAALTGIFIGARHESSRCIAAAQHAATAAAATSSRAASAAQAVADKAVIQQADIRTIYRDRIITEYKEVPREVIRKEDAGCVIPNRFVGMWNSANRAELPTFSSQLDAAPSGVALSDVAAQHDREAELCTANTAQLIALQNAERARQSAMQGSVQ